MNSADHLVRRSTFLRFCLCVMAFVIGLIAGPATVSAAPFTEDFGTNTGDVASFNFQRSGVTFTMTYSPANGGGTLFWDGSVGEGGGPGILTSPTNQTGQMHTVTIARADGAGWVLTSIYLDTATSITATANLVGGGTSQRTATAAGTVSFGGVAVTSLVLTGTDFGYGVIDTLVGDTTDDTVAPTVASITATTANGTYKTGDTIQIAVTFSETVIVTGTPQLALNSGGTASYSSGSGTSTLNFNYTVQAGDAAFDLDYVATGSLVLNGGTIRDAAPNDAVLTLPVPGGANSLGANRNIVIDGVAPTVTNVTATTANGTYRTGDSIAVTVTFSEAVTVIGTPQLTLETGTTDRTLNYASGSGTTTLTFSYTVQAGDASADLDYTSTTALVPNGGRIADTAQNGATLTLPTPGAAGSLGANKALVIDGVVPVVQSVTLVGSPAASATAVTFRITFSEAVTSFSVGDVQVTTTGAAAGTATGLSGSGTTYDVTVASISGTGTIRLDVKAGTPIADAAGNTGVAAYTGGSVFTVDGVPPAAPAVTAPSNGATVLTASPAPSGTAEPASTVTVIIDGNASGTTTADGAGNWNFTIPAPLSQGVHTIRATATDAAGNVSPSSVTNSFTVDSVAPTVTSMSVPANGTYGTGTTLSFTVNTGEAVVVDTSGGTPRIAITLGAATVYAAYASGSGSTALLFQYTVQPGDDDPNGIIIGALSANGGTLRDISGNDLVLTLNSVGSTANVLVDTTAATVSSVSVPANGTYTAGQNLDFTVTFTETVVVNTTGGTPRIALVIGATSVSAAYVSGSGTTSLVFRHTVGTGSSDSDGIAIGAAITLEGGTITDAASSAATMTLNSVGSTAGVLVDAMAPAVVLTAPAGLQTGTFTVMASFSEPVTGFAVADLAVTGGTAGNFAGGGATYTFDITPAGGGTVTITVPAGVADDASGNDNTASVPLTVSTGSAQGEFAARQDEIRGIIIDAAADALRSRIRATQRMLDGAQDRLVSGDAAAQDDPLDGMIDAGGGTFSSKGSYSRSFGLADGGRRIVSGDVDLARDAAGTVTLAIDARTAWEYTLSGRTLYGFYLGAGLGSSQVEAGFDGPVRSATLNAGIYGVTRLSDRIFLDGFLGASAGRNDLDLSNGVLALASTYRTYSVEAGASLGGRIPMKGWEMRPELSVTMGRTVIGDVDFTGAAFGAAAALSLDAGALSLFSVSVAPEILIPLDGEAVDITRHSLSLHPLLSCEVQSGIVSATDCGGGLGIGLSSRSHDGLRRFDGRFDLRRIGADRDRSLTVSFEQRF